MFNRIIKPRLAVRYRLPVDPCRMLGGKKADAQQARPTALNDQVSPQEFAKTLKTIGARGSSYKAKQLRKFRHGGLQQYKPPRIYWSRSDAIGSNEK